MRLALALLRRKGMPGGHIYRGKYRIVKEPTQADIAKLRAQFAIEEENMLYLRHPYLTSEQSHGHAKALQKPEQRMERLKSLKLEFKPHVRLEDRLAHLRVKEGWD